MASELGSNTAAQLRNRCNDVDTTDYADAALDVIITKHEHLVYVKLARATSSPYTTADDVFEVVNLAILESAACEVYGGIDNTKDQKDAACKYAEELIQAIKGAPTSGGGASGKLGKTQGFNNR